MWIKRENLWTSCGKVCGLFGTLYNATVKNLTVNQTWYGHYWGVAAVAQTAYYTTFENIIVNISCDPITGTDYAPVLQEMAGCIWKNCTISSNNSVGIIIGTAKKDNIDSTYENVNITAVSTKFSKDIDSFDSIQQLQPETATMPERQDFVLDGEWELRDLGAYNGLEILSVVTEHGESLNGISPVAARNILTDKTKHGEQNFTVTVLKEDGNKAIITVPVTVITKEITTMSELQDATKVVSETESKYGYYVLANDVAYNETGFVLVNAKGNFSSGGAFRGVLDGRKHTILTNSSSTVSGLFGTLSGATIKNVTIEDAWKGMGWSVPIIARNAYSTVFESVDITVKGGKVDDGTVDHTPFIGNTMQNCTWKKVNVVSAVDIVNVFANQTGNTFEEVTIKANVTGGFSITNANFPTGVEKKS